MEHQQKVISNVSNSVILTTFGNQLQFQGHSIFRRWIPKKWFVVWTKFL